VIDWLWGSGRNSKEGEKPEMTGQTNSRPQVIAIEEHYLDKEVDTYIGGKGGGASKTKQRLEDLGAERVAEMDKAGIDIQVLSHCPPGAQAFSPEDAARLGPAVNDRLHQFVTSNPSRFAAFATLPLRDPAAAANELERAVTKLGFKGAMVHGLTDGLFIDDKRFWPIFERAEALDVPIYVHPAHPHPAVVEAYYKDYVKTYPGILTSGWGFTVETATAGVRLVLSGVFSKHPKLKILLGHLGESLPFSLWRIDAGVSRAAGPDGQGMAFRDLFREHFWITTSGNFSTPALMCCIMEMGTDRILFGVDWPYVENVPGTKWMDELPISPEDKEKIYCGNARKLLRM
jgi:2,3-dihydroxybenzoate decarboxylase